MAVHDGADDSMGLEALPELWKHVDNEVGLLCAQAVVSERTARGEGAAPPVSGMSANLF